MGVSLFCSESSLFSRTNLDYYFFGLFYRFKIRKGKYAPSSNEAVLYSNTKPTPTKKSPPAKKPQKPTPPKKPATTTNGQRAKELEAQVELGKEDEEVAEVDEQCYENTVFIGEGGGRGGYLCNTQMLY